MGVAVGIIMEVAVDQPDGCPTLSFLDAVDFHWSERLRLSKAAAAGIAKFELSSPPLISDKLKLALLSSVSTAEGNLGCGRGFFSSRQHWAAASGCSI